MIQSCFCDILVSFWIWFWNKYIDDSNIYNDLLKIKMFVIWIHLFLFIEMISNKICSNCLIIASLKFYIIPVDLFSLNSNVFLCSCSIKNVLVEFKNDVIEIFLEITAWNKKCLLCTNWYTYYFFTTNFSSFEHSFRFAIFTKFTPS